MKVPYFLVLAFLFEWNEKMGIKIKASYGKPRLQQHNHSSTNCNYIITIFFQTYYNYVSFVELCFLCCLLFLKFYILCFLWKLWITLWITQISTFQKKVMHTQMCIIILPIIYIFVMHFMCTILFQDILHTKKPYSLILKGI